KKTKFMPNVFTFLPKDTSSTISPIMPLCPPKRVYDSRLNKRQPPTAKPNLMRGFSIKKKGKKPKLATYKKGKPKAVQKLSNTWRGMPVSKSAFLARACNKINFKKPGCTHSSASKNSR